VEDIQAYHVSVSIFIASRFKKQKKAIDKLGHNGQTNRCLVTMSLEFQEIHSEVEF